MIQEKYNKLKSKYRLPDFSEINNEFEISTIEQEDFLLREIRREIAERISFFADLIGGILNPEASASIMEFGVLGDDDSKQAIELYKKLMYWVRYSAETSVFADDKKDAEFIKSIFEEWKSLKKEVAAMISKMKESWRQKPKKEEDEYLL